MKKKDIREIMLIIIITALVTGLPSLFFGMYLGELDYHNKIKDNLPLKKESYSWLEKYKDEAMKNHWYQYDFSYDGERHYLELETWSDGMTYIFFTGEDCERINITTSYFEEYRNNSYNNRWEIYLKAGETIGISFNYDTKHYAYINLYVIQETEDFMGQKYPFKTKMFEVKT
jgi:hypothetical protein